jgi:hypothetical protein
MKYVNLSIMSLILLLVSGSVSGQAIDDCGRILDGTIAGCVFFVSDNYGSYELDDLQGYQTGDYIRAVGMIDPDCQTECVQGQGCLTDYTLSDCGAEPPSCGDSDGSGGIDLDDVVFLIYYIYGGGPVPNPYASGDADCSGGIDLDDVVYLIYYIYGGGPYPCDPNDDGFPDC